MAGEKILIVDDQQSIQELLKTICLREGYEPLVATTVQQARSLIAEQKPDAAIVDLWLSDGNGIEVLRYVKEVDPTSQVVILTGHGDLDTAVEALRLGAFDYLQKADFSVRLISIVLRRALERRHLILRNEQLIRELKLANRELQRRQAQQLKSIDHISRALSGGLRIPDLVQMIVQTALGTTDCDGAGAMVASPELTDHPITVVGSRGELSTHAKRALVQALSAHLPDDMIFPEPGSIQTITLGAESSDDNDWQILEFDWLKARENPVGVVVVAWHDQDAVTEEALAAFRLIVAQGSIALENAYLFQRMCELATRDSLTGLYNHGHFFELLERELSRSDRYHFPVAVIMMDIDKSENRGLKYFNDTFGHPTGDELLRQVAARLQINVRLSDTLARYGGDEFVILAPETDNADAIALARRLWQAIREEPFRVRGIEAPLTASFGVAVHHPGEKHTPNELVEEADQACYLAKKRGGDRVCIFTPAEKSDP